jgi:hypothetical protein
MSANAQSFLSKCTAIAHFARVCGSRVGLALVSILGTRARAGLVTCRVPKLKGKTLKAARKALTKAHCLLGKVRKPRHPHGRLVVRRQSPAAGKVRAKNTRVTVTLAVAAKH